jgi:predicted 3-demethylubiquinone-9 3-methyltransferase (glyoxalase superfamily)
MATLQKITPNLWFDRQAEDAANFYVSVFKNSSIIRTSYYTNAGQDIHKMPEGMVMTVEFELEGQKFTGLNGGPIFKFNEAVSFIINCEDQQEIDYYWNKLGEGGDPKAQVCGWLKDKFGLSWQVTTNILTEMLLDKDKEKAQRAMNAMMQMKKIDIQQLRDAFEGK